MSMPVEDRDNCPYATLDGYEDLHPAHQRVYGMLASQVLRRIVDVPGDRAARRLFGVLPRLLLVDRRMTRYRNNSQVNLFMGRVRRVLELRDMEEMLQPRDCSTRTRASSVVTEERVRKDVLRCCQRGAYSRAGTIAMSGEVAQPNEHAERVAKELYPDAELPEDLPEPRDSPHLDKAIFMHNIGADASGRVKVATAADSAGHRWEHIAWIVAAGGAEDLYVVCDRLFRGEMKDENDEDWSWIFNAKLVLLIKKETESTRVHEYRTGELRPIAPGAILLRLISGVGAKQTGPAFEKLFDPGTAGDGIVDEVAPVVQAGAGVRGAAEQVQHSVVELLAADPEMFLLQVDGDMAFQLAKRTTFLGFQHRHGLGTYTWSKRCYGGVTYVYFRRADGTIVAIRRAGGTAQGDPLSPGNQCMALQAALEMAQLEFPDQLRSRQFWYLDDGSIGARQDDLIAFIRVIASPDFAAQTGYRVNFGKCSVWHRKLVEWTTQEMSGEEDFSSNYVSSRGEQQQQQDNRDAEEVRNGLLAELPEGHPGRMMRGIRDPRMFSGEEEIRDNRGVTLLGVPVCGTSDYARRKVSEIVKKARKYVDRIRQLLLPSDFEEYTALIRTTLPGRFAHVCRAVVPDRVIDHAREFDALQVEAYAAAVGQLESDDIPVVETIFMQQGAGGRGYREMAVEVYTLYDGAWAQSAHRISQRWESGDARELISTPMVEAYPGCNVVELARFGLDHRDQLQRTHELLRRVEARATSRSMHGEGTCMEQLAPTGVRAPQEPIPALATYSSETRARLTNVLTTFTTAMRLESILGDATPRGRAQVRDMSVAGAGAWLRSRPSAPSEDRGPFHHFPDGGARVEHRAALLLRPPGEGHHCHGCGRAAWDTYAHLGVCPAGSRCTGVLHHPVKKVLLDMLRSVLPNACVLDGDEAQPRGQHAGPGGGPWWSFYSEYKRPDIILVNYPRTGVHTIIDVKTFDAAGDTHIRSNHTEYFTRGAHRELERGLIQEYTTIRDRDGRAVEMVTRARAIGSNQLVCAAVSRQGAVGEQLLGLIREMAGMHAQRAQDGLIPSYSFLEVWRHRLSLCVHTQAATRLQSLLSHEEIAVQAEEVRRAVAGHDGIAAEMANDFFGWGDFWEGVDSGEDGGDGVADNLGGETDVGTDAESEGGEGPPSPPRLAGKYMCQKLAHCISRALC